VASVLNTSTLPTATSCPQPVVNCGFGIGRFAGQVSAAFATMRDRIVFVDGSDAAVQGSPPRGVPH
jgi:hypothetical protein